MSDQNTRCSLRSLASLRIRRSAPPRKSPASLLCPIDNVPQPLNLHFQLAQKIIQPLGVHMERYRFNKSKVVKMQLVCTSEKRSIAKFLAHDGPPVLVIALPSVDVIVVAPLWPGCPVKQMVDGPRYILCQFINHLLFSTPS